MRVTTNRAERTNQARPAAVIAACAVAALSLFGTLTGGPPRPAGPGSSVPRDSS
jgi:hypothetical protein